MKQYFIDGQDQQSFTIEELKAKKITRETMIWFEGSAGWDKAGNLPELASVFSSTPPPLKPSVTPPPMTNGVKSSGKKKLVLIISAVVILLGGAIGAYAVFGGTKANDEDLAQRMQDSIAGADAIMQVMMQEKADSTFRADSIASMNSEQVQSQSSAPKQTEIKTSDLDTSLEDWTGISSVLEAEKANPLEFLEVTFDYDTQADIISGTVTNNARCAYKEIELKLVFYSKSNKKLDTKYFELKGNIRPSGDKDFMITDFSPLNTKSINITVGSARWDSSY